jgi:aarF domain-containing kinase
MRKEVDLANEARNSEKTARYLANEPALKDKVMVPKIHWPYTGTSVMTAEFVKAVMLTDVEGLKKYRLEVKPVMDNVIALFAAMTFKWGWVSISSPPPPTD